MKDFNLDYYANSLLMVSTSHGEYYEKYQPHFHRLNDLLETLSKSKRRLHRQMEQFDITDWKILKCERHLSAIYSLAIAQKKFIVKQIILDISDNLPKSFKGLIKRPGGPRVLYQRLYDLNLKIKRELANDEFGFLTSAILNLKCEIEKKLKFLAVCLRKCAGNLS